MILSIIVPVYNMMKNSMLKTCMDSLVHQTVSNLGSYEIIAIDDASTDDSLKLLQEYKNNYPDVVKVISREKNGKQGAARNDGIKAAKGKWLGFVDADDWIANDMYEKLIRAANVNDADCAGCYSCYVESKNQQISSESISRGNLHTGELSIENLEKAICLGEDMWNKIYLRTTILDNELFFPENQYYEDNAVAGYFNIMSRRYVLVKEPLYFYYKNPESTCNIMNVDKIYDRIKAGNYFMEMSRKLKLSYDYKNMIHYGFFYSVVYCGVTHVWKCNENIYGKYKLLKLMRNNVRKYGVDIVVNPLFEKYVPEQKRAYSLFEKSPLLFMIYHFYSQNKHRI